MSKYSSVRILFYLFVLLSHCQIRQTRLMHHQSRIKETFRNVNVPTQLISDHLSKFIKTKQDEVILASTEWRIQKYHKRTDRQTDTQRDFLGFLSKPKRITFSLKDLKTPAYPHKYLACTPSVIQVISLRYLCLQTTIN